MHVDDMKPSASEAAEEAANKLEEHLKSLQTLNADYSNMADVEQQIEEEINKQLTDTVNSLLYDEVAYFPPNPHADMEVEVFNDELSFEQELEEVNKELNEIDEEIEALEKELYPTDKGWTPFVPEKMKVNAEKLLISEITYKEALAHLDRAIGGIRLGNLGVEKVLRSLDRACELLRT